MIKLVDYIRQMLFKPVSIAPLSVFRLLFGFIMAVSIARFVIKGWVYDLYIMPKFFFPYYGFEWIKPLDGNGMYLIFGLMFITALMIMLGLFYRWAAFLFFIAFTYVELLDKTNYLNHYYFVSIISFLLIWVPANRYFSIDCLRKPHIRTELVPFWMIAIFQLQIGLVYFYAGVAKLNHDWLLEALPLKIWLPAKSGIPVIGNFLDKTWVAFFFSWAGAIFDLSISFFLLIRRTRPFAYVAVVIFHLMTGLLFPIGMFPFIMILSTLIFFPAKVHRNIIDKLSGLRKTSDKTVAISKYTNKWQPQVTSILAVFIILQFLLPWRYTLYPGNLFWTEQGYRFSWRVMLMEKAGYATFYIKDPESGKSGIVDNYQYLTPYQVKMMSSQPDMILQFAHFLEKKYKAKGIIDPEIRVEAYATLNGSGSRPYIDPDIDLTRQKFNLKNRDWILPYENSYDQ